MTSVSRDVERPYDALVRAAKVYGEEILVETGRGDEPRPVDAPTFAKPAAAPKPSTPRKGRQR